MMISQKRSQVVSGSCSLNLRDISLVPRIVQNIISDIKANEENECV